MAFTSPWDSERGARGERGEFNYVNWILLVIGVAGGYLGVQFGPAYMHRFQMTSICRKMAIRMNVEHDVEKIRKQVISEAGNIGVRLKHKQVRVKKDAQSVEVAWTEVVKHPWGAETVIESRAFHQK